MSRRTTKTIFTIILSIVMVVAIILSYITHDKRFFSDGYKYKTGGAFASTRELIIKPIEKTEKIQVIVDKDGKVLRKAPYDRGKEFGIEPKDGPLTLTDKEYSPDPDFKSLKKVTKNLPLNNKEILTEDNFKLSQENIIKRLKKTGVEDFDIKTDSKTGDIVLRFQDVNEAESKKLDKVKRVLTTRGSFSVMDSKTGKEYLNNSHIKKLTPYVHQTAGVVLEIEFNSEGKKILEDITSKYVKRERKLTDAQLKKLEEEAKKEDKELDTTETAALYMTLDEQPISMGAFEEKITSGTLTIPLSQETNKMKETELKEAEDEGKELTAIIESGVEPVRYDIFKETRLVSPMDKQNIITLLVIVLVLVIALLVLSIVLYRFNGVLGWFLSTVFLLLLFTIFKYTNIAITIPTIVGMITMYLIQYIYTLYILKDVKTKDETNIGKNLFLITRNTILIIVAGVVLTFAKETNLSSFGQIICLGELLLIIYNSIFAKNILK